MEVADGKADLSKSQLDRIKAQTPDPIGGVGYNVKPIPGLGANANWGGANDYPKKEFRWAAVSQLSKRLVFASSYDWHLEGDARAYHRFGKEKALATFFDGSSRFVNKAEFDKAIASPGI